MKIFSRKCILIFIEPAKLSLGASAGHIRGRLHRCGKLWRAHLSELFIHTQ